MLVKKVSLPSSPVSPLFRTSVSNETTTLVASGDDTAALGVVAMLVQPVGLPHPILDWTFRSGTIEVRCSWRFAEIITTEADREFEGSITAGRQTRSVRLIVTDDSLTARPNTIQLTTGLVGVGCQFTPEHALLRVLTTVFCRQQKAHNTFRREVQHSFVA